MDQTDRLRVGPTPLTGLTVTTSLTVHNLTAVAATANPPNISIETKISNGLQ